MNSSTIALLYAAALHLMALAALTILMILGKITWGDGGPLVAYLLGFGAGVPVTIAAASKPSA